MATRTGGTKPLWQKKIAEERIEILFREAEKMSKANRLEFAKRYILLARKIGMRYNVKMPRDLRGKFCRKCHSFLAPEKTCVVDKDEKRKIIKVKCFNCDRIIRISQK